MTDADFTSNGTRNNGTDDDHYRNVYEIYLLWENRSRIMFKLAYPIIIIIGTVANMLTIIVLSKRLSDASAFPLLFMALSITDLLLLYVALIPSWIGKQFNVWILHESEGACKFLTWMEYSLVSLSAWFLAAMTAHRAMTIVWPTQTRRMRPRLHAVVTIVILTASSFVVNSYVLDALTKRDPSGLGLCVWEAAFAAEILPVLEWLRITCNSILPSGIIILCNCLMIRAVKQSTERSRNGRRKDALNQMTVSLIAVSLTFIFLTIPVYALRIAVLLNRNVYNDGPFLFWYRFTVILLATNSAINFFLYVLTGTRFREEVKKMFRRQPARPTAVRTAAVKAVTSV